MDNEIKKLEKNDDNDFISRKHNELLVRKQIIILEPMSEERINELLPIAKQYSDMSTYVMRDGDSRRIVLRYKVIENLDIKKIVSECSLAYQNEEYSKCIELYTKLLQGIRKPNAFIYGRIGLSYMKIKQFDIAIDFLTIATYRAKKEGSKLDFTDLITKLKCKTNNKESSFNDELDNRQFQDAGIDNYYGISNFKEINNQILETGIDVESVCKNLGMTDEQICLVKLIYAREFYFQERYLEGDMFLKSVERTKNKTKIVVKIFNETVKNKRFYCNRDQKNSVQLIYSIRPSAK